MENHRKRQKRPCELRQGAEMAEHRSMVKRFREEEQRHLTRNLLFGMIPPDQEQEEG